MEKTLQNKEIAILGSGITGLSAAFYLLRAGARVTVFEARPELGGLASYFDFGDFWWDRFYHCILTSDAPLLQLIEDLGLSEQMRWQQTKVGFFGREKLYSMSTSVDFLRFPLLSFWSKFRLALGILYVCAIRDGRKLEGYKVSDWLTRVFGTANYRKMWGPLLKCKLGTCREEASAAFIWATITRLYSTRDKNSGQQERLGYVRGGYRTVFNRLQEEISRRGGQILTSAPVERILKDGDGVNLTVQGQVQRFDHVISTIPSRLLADIAPELSPDYVQKLTRAKYLGIVCFALILKRKLSPFYVTNLAEEDIPFTGIIEMTNLISREETAGHHLVYLPKYTAPNDPLFEASEEQIWELFKKSLVRVFPDLQDSDIERRYLFRERFVQPVPVLHYSDIVPAMRTNVQGLILANTTQIINSTLNNNAMVKIARQAVEIVISVYGKTSPQAQSEAGVPAADVSSLSA
jgi:protoporphyrinogen oxidase